MTEERIQIRQVRVVDLVAEMLEANADAMPPSHKDEAESIRKEAAWYRASSNPKTMLCRIHFVQE